MLAASLAVVVVGAALPLSPLSHDLGFLRLPAGYFAALAAMVAGYLALAEPAKREFYRHLDHPRPPARPAQQRRVERRAARLSHAGPLSS